MTGRLISSELCRFAIIHPSPCRPAPHNTFLMRIVLERRFRRSTNQKSEVRDQKSEEKSCSEEGSLTSDLRPPTFGSSSIILVVAPVFGLLLIETRLEVGNGVGDGTQLRP